MKSGTKMGMGRLVERHGSGYGTGARERGGGLKGGLFAGVFLSLSLVLMIPFFQRIHVSPYHGRLYISSHQGNLTILHDLNCVHIP